MYRLVIRVGTMFLKPIKRTTKTNNLTRNMRNIHLSFVRVSENDIEFSDDLISTPYSEIDRLKRLKRCVFENYLKTTLHCPVNVATDIWLTYPVLRDRCLQDVQSNVNLLTEKGVTTILDNPSLLCMGRATLRSRLLILESMKPHKIEDFIPLAIVADERLNKIKTIAENETDHIPSGHRIYHFSKLLDMEPYTISKYASNRLLMLEMPFTAVDSRIKAMLKYKTPAQIVANLSKIRYSDKYHELVSQTKLNENLALNKKTNSLAQYYANRLNCDIENVHKMLESYPFLIKEFVLIDKKLDFLLNEVGVDATEIICYPHILKKNLETLTERFQELQFYGYGHRPHRQIVLKLTLPDKEYKKFLVKLKETWEQQQQQSNYLARKWINFRKMFHF